MSNSLNLPTKSEINERKEKESEVIVLNIHNKNNANFSETIDNINQTEENLYIKDNYNDLIKPEKNKIIYYDNVREKSNNYPLSEKRVIQTPTQFTNNKYYKSVNPYSNNNNYQINNNKFNGPYMNYKNNEIKKKPIIYHPIKKGEKSKQVKKISFRKIFIICCAGTSLFFLFPPIGIIYCLYKFSKESKKMNN